MAGHIQAVTVHHLQATVPGLDNPFQNLHKQRNRGRARTPLDNYRGFGRTDEYIDNYFGAEYLASVETVPPGSVNLTTLESRLKRT